MFTLAYLLSASPIAPTCAHVAMHVAAVIHAYGASIPLRRITEFLLVLCTESKKANRLPVRAGQGDDGALIPGRCAAPPVVRGSRASAPISVAAAFSPGSRRRGGLLDERREAIG